jgi:HD-GYP domain-containing protein (c-di-GMP phosphodiesterase class II)
VSELAIELGHTVHLDAEHLDEVARAAELHDIGKIAVPDVILHKRAPLNSGEWEIMRNHPVIGERILSSAPAMAPVAKLVRSTHERWDGSGYPDGLAEGEIPLGSRLIALCDAFVAMTDPRPWRPALTFEAAASELQRCAGTQFDPGLVASFCAFVYPDLLPDTDAGRFLESSPSGGLPTDTSVHLEAQTEATNSHRRSDAINPHESAEPDLSA